MAIQQAKIFKRGQLARATAEFHKNDGTDDLVDPDTVRAIIKKPGNSPELSTHTYPGSPSDIIKTATGRYYIDLDLDVANVWHVRWESDGDWQAAEELAFNVKGGAFAP